MTIKVKIIIGFIALMLITVIASTIGYKGFTVATENLGHVRRYALADTGVSDFIANTGSSYRRLVLYMKDAKEEDAKAIETFIESAKTNIADVLSNIRNPEMNEKVKKIQANNDTFSELLLAMVKRSREANDAYNNIVRPSSLKCIQALKEIGKSATVFDNVRALSLLSEAWGKFSLLLPSIARYNTSYLDKDRDDVKMCLDEFTEAVKNIDSTLARENGRKAYKEATDALKEIQDALGLMVTSIDRLSARYTELLNIRTTMEDQSQELGRFTVAQATSIFEQAKMSNNSGQTQLFTSSLAGAVIGIVLALVIILSLVRVLKDVSAFASAIARGDFSYKVKVKEKGEIGQMVSGMQQIPHVLQELIDGTIAGVKKMQVGYFNERVDAKAYSGAYADLVNAVNTVADTYTTILDEMPVPLLTADKSNKVYYSNNASEETLQGNLLESYITEGESNFGIKAIESGQSYTSESTFMKDDKSRTMAVTAVPLNDYDGNPAAFIEIITDLTDIKEQQRVMLQVAEEATEIATRVAAASEEIAAQVEQVSRGADVQRSRVESTASAMTEMNATVIEVARSASEAAEQSDNTRSKAEDGSELVNSVMKSINQVNAVSQNLHSNMQELGTQAESIGNVMNVISDIADQTNLLALNAAIEAARAGEAGRGFAVVADEVRKLAEKTMQATQEVGSSISAVQQSARVNIDEVSKAVTAVEEANQLANSSGEALSEIVNLASANSNVVNSIATAAEEQSATSSEISNALTEINTIVGETTEGMVQSSAAIQDLSSMAQDLQRVMSGLR